MSVKVTLEEVERVAELARLRLSRKELEQFSGQLSHILTYMDAVNAVETAGLDAAPAACGAASLREDEVRPSLSREQALSNAPETSDGLFRVPPVLDSR